jgi:hypothetical protein
MRFRYAGTALRGCRRIALSTTANPRLFRCKSRPFRGYHSCSPGGYGDADPRRGRHPRRHPTEAHRAAVRQSLAALGAR